jgi:UDP-N-acetylmuramoyl-tripeptide--D-alanyl-D-alanine ligase
MISRIFRRIFGPESDWRDPCGILAAYIWRRLMFRTTFVAITGSVGKTTAKELLAAILATQGPTVANYGTGNGRRRIIRTIFRVRFRHRFAIIEVGTEAPGQIGRSGWLVGPDIAVILNVARMHTRSFPTLEHMAAEKSRLLRHLRRKGVAILNRDDPRVAAMAASLRNRDVRSRIMWFGCEPDVAVHGSSISSHWPEDPLSLTISTGPESYRVHTRLVGEHWKTSVLGAVAAALQCGVPMPQIVAALAGVRPTPGRLAPKTLPSGVTFLSDDYNGSEDTFQAALEVLRQARAPRKILVFAGAQDSEGTWTQRMARLCSEAATAADLLVLIGTRGCTHAGARAARAAGMKESQIAQFEGIRAASDFLNATCSAGDLVLLRGRMRQHLGRLYFAQQGAIACWLPECNKRILCQDCPELQATISPLIAASEIRMARS